VPEREGAEGASQKIEFKSFAKTKRTMRKSCFFRRARESRSERGKLFSPGARREKFTN